MVNVRMNVEIPDDAYEEFLEELETDSFVQVTYYAARLGENRGISLSKIDS
jgi:hypothetical protein